jgi:hypothetical protein
VPLDWVHPEDRQVVADALEQLKARPGETLSLVYRAQHADGHWVWLESRCTNLLQDPLVQGIVCSSRDITQQKQVELALRESEARFREIAEAVPVVFFVYSADLSQSLYKSPQSEKHLGLHSRRVSPQARSLERQDPSRRSAKGTAGGRPSHSRNPARSPTAFSIGMAGCAGCVLLAEPILNEQQEVIRYCWHYRRYYGAERSRAGSTRKRSSA